MIMIKFKFGICLEQLALLEINNSGIAMEGKFNCQNNIYNVS